ncbi:MAG: hypothetical protein AMXMBFR68_05710 [Ignavibacteria bacterium]
MLVIVTSPGVNASSHNYRSWIDEADYESVSSLAVLTQTGIDVSSLACLVLQAGSTMHRGLEC